MIEVQRFGGTEGEGVHTWCPDCRSECTQFVKAHAFDTLAAENTALEARCRELEAQNTAKDERINRLKELRDDNAALEEALRQAFSPDNHVRQKAYQVLQSFASETGGEHG